MNNKIPTEERYPLLLLYVEENGKKSEFPQRVVFADKGRGKEVIKGAAAIITQWPAQITSCWLTSVAMASTFILVTFILFIGSLNPLLNPIHPRCTRDIENYDGNKTIHLVKQGINWNSKQLDVLSYIAKTYPDFKIHNIIVDISKSKLLKHEVATTTMAPVTEAPKVTTTAEQHFLLFPKVSSIFFKKFSSLISNDPKSVDNKEQEKSNEIVDKENNVVFIPQKNTYDSNFVEPKFSFMNLTSPFLKRSKRCLRLNIPTKTYEDILNTYPNIKEKKITYRQYFQHTPLQFYWPDLNTEMVNFAIRVQELWQNGGISFYLPANQDDKELKDQECNQISSTIINEDLINITALKVVITNTKYHYEVLPDENVSIDAKGMHMATRVPCHTFFGEMLMKMQRDTDKLTVPSFIKQILNIFCKRGAVDSEYCNRK